MPTYEYRCPKGHEFEKFFRSISAAEAEREITCPVCGAIATRELSSAGLMFKGSGFYLTDYGKNAHGKKGPPATAGSSDGSSSGGESSGGGDSGGSGKSGSSDGGGGGSSDSSSGGSSSGSSGNTSGSTGGGGGDSSSKGGDSKKSSKPTDAPGKSTKPSSSKPKE